MYTIYSGIYAGTRPALGVIPGYATPQEALAELQRQHTQRLATEQRADGLHVFVETREIAIIEADDS
jgi:hypothetical protein